MLSKIQRALWERKVRRLARKAIAEAIRLFQSGELGWTKGVLFRNGGDYSDASPKALENGTQACALGGVAKAAWIVCGRPTVHDEDRWLLKEYVEATAMAMAYSGLERALGRDEVASYNDSLYHEGGMELVIENVLKPALEVEPVLTTDSPYFSVNAEQLAHRYQDPIYQ